MVRIGTELRQASSWLWLGGAFVVVSLISAFSAWPSAEPAPLSAHSGRPDGTLAAYLWLDRIGHQVQIREELDFRSAQDTLLLLSPQSELTRENAVKVLNWVQGGGHVVLATEGSSNRELVRLLGVSTQRQFPGPVRVSQPVLLSPPVVRLDGPAYTALKGNTGAVAAVTTGGPVLTRRVKGHGEVWLLTAPELLITPTLHMPTTADCFSISLLATGLASCFKKNQWTLHLEQAVRAG